MGNTEIAVATHMQYMGVVVAKNTGSGCQASGKHTYSTRCAYR